jgi:predicted MFS family arabinose efflux permease
MQTWMTDAVADGRAIGMSFFSIALFAGSTIGAALGQAAAGAGDFSLLFAASAVGAGVFGAATSLARSRYRVRER